MAAAARETNETGPPETFEAEADSRGRVTLGKGGAEPGQRYRVRTEPDGTMTLTPVVTIPRREMPVWTDPDLRAALLDGLEATERGERGIDRGDFSQYLDEEGEA